MEKNRSLKIIAHLFFLVMLVFAGRYYLERMLFADGSFYIFKMTCFRTFIIEAGRYSAILTQAIPLALIRMHATLRTVILGYSLSFILVYYLFFLLATYGFGSLKAGLAATLVLVLGVSDSAMYPVSEMQLGLLSSILFYAFTEYYFLHSVSFSKRKRLWLLFTGTILIFLCMFSHPSTLFAVIFILAFQAVDKGVHRKRDFWLFILVAAIIFGAKFLSIHRNSYEGHQLAPANDLLSTLSHFTSIYSVHFFVKYISKGIYILPFILLLLLFAWYRYRRDYAKLLFQLAAFSGFFIILMILFAPGDSDAGMEKNLLPLWLFVAIPFAHDLLLDSHLKKNVRWLLYVAVILAGFAGIHRAMVIHTNRIAYVKELLEAAHKQSGAAKFIIACNDVNQDKLPSTWSIANESLLLSSISGPLNSKTIYLVDDTAKLPAFASPPPDVFISVSFWPLWNYKLIDTLYFGLPKQPYELVKGPLPK